MAGTLYSLLRPLLFRLEPETAHALALHALRRGLVPRPSPVAEPILGIHLWGIDFPNPVGLAAGFDKNAVAVDALFEMGFGFVEVGSVTPAPQTGNPRPRLFRLPDDHAVVNRMGFNNDGLVALAARLEARTRSGILGVNLGKNKASEEAISDYVLGVDAMGALADYLVVNVSSPNTPGLRALQGREPLEALLRAVLTARDRLEHGRPPVLLKIAPDLTSEDEEDIAAVALDVGIDGLIATNTTIERPDGLSHPHRAQSGGLSGRPLFERSTQVLARMYYLTQGCIPIIGVGGIESGSDAYAKIRAGASLVQLYTALVYHGPWLAARVAQELATLLRADGFSSLAQAVGSGNAEALR